DGRIPAKGADLQYAPCTTHPRDEVQQLAADRCHLDSGQPRCPLRRQRGFQLGIVPDKSVGEEFVGQAPVLGSRFSHGSTQPRQADAVKGSVIASSSPPTTTDSIWTASASAANQDRSGTGTGHRP